VLINQLLMASGCHHFEAKQGPEAHEWWRHIRTSHSAYPVDLKSVEPVQKHVDKCEKRIIPELNGIILLKLLHGWHTTISVWARRNLTRRRWFKMAQILMLKRNYNPRQSISVFSFPPSNLASGAAVKATLQ